MSNEIMNEAVATAPSDTHVDTHVETTVETSVETSAEGSLDAIVEVAGVGEFIDVIAAVYPGTPLRVGSRGDAVRCVQIRLNELSGRYPLIQSLTEDGIYGDATADAVKAFQRIFGLTVDGIVGPLTWSKLMNEGEGVYPGAPLRVGSRCGSVKLIQRRLNALSGRYPLIPRIAEDGIYGDATAEAVGAFQRIYGLNADGIVGPVTWSELMNDGRPVYPGAPLRIGASGEAVRHIQRCLNKLSERYSSIPRLVEDGRYGEATASAVKTFQRLFGLSVDGVVGPASWGELMEQCDCGDAPSMRSMADNISAASHGHGHRNRHHFNVLIFSMLWRALGRRW